jgi:hypothetical protein
VLQRLGQEEQQLWDRVSQSSFDARISVPTQGTSAEVKLVHTLLQRELRRLMWWRYPLVALGMASLALLFFFQINDLIKSGFRLKELLSLILTPLHGFILSFLLYKIKPSVRWINGIQLLMELSRRVDPDEVIESLMYVSRLDALRVPLKKDSLAPVLYHRLAEVLLRASAFVPDEKQRKFLENVTLSPARYPEPLRIAALLTLGDHPEALSETFRTKLAALIAKDASDALTAAAQEVLNRR